MRKRNFNFYFDKLFWAVIVLLPIFILLLSWFRLGTTQVTLTSVLTGMGVSNNNVIYSTLVSIFGEGGSAFNLFTATDIYYFATYMVGIELLHLLVDFLLFIPRLCHKFMHKFTQEDC